MFCLWLDDVRYVSQLPTIHPLIREMDRRVSRTIIFYGWCRTHEVVCYPKTKVCEFPVV